MKKQGPTYNDFNFMVRHDNTSSGQHAPAEYLFHSLRGAETKVTLLRRFYPGTPVYVIDREEYAAGIRVQKAYSKQDCS